MDTNYELYCAGSFEDGIGSCSWYAIDTISRDLANCKGTLVGPTRAVERMQLRAVFEGLLRLPVGSKAHVYLETIPDAATDTDIDAAIKKVIGDRRLTVDWCKITPVDSEDLPVFPGEILNIVNKWASNAVIDYKNKNL